MPSARAANPLIVHSPTSFSPIGNTARRLFRWMAGTLATLVVAVALLAVIVQSGAIDEFLAARADVALEAAIGPDHRADIGDVDIRLASTGLLALRARDVAIAGDQSPVPLGRIGSLRLSLSMAGLLRGDLGISAIEIEGAAFDPAAFGKGPDASVETMRVETIGAVFDRAFEQTSAIAAGLAARGLTSVRLVNVNLGPAEAPLVRFEALSVHRTGNGALDLKGDLLVAGKDVRLSGTAEADRAGRIRHLTIAADGLDTDALLLGRNAEGQPTTGISTTADIVLSARRAGAGSSARLGLDVAFAPGRLYADGVDTDLKASRLSLEYRFARKTIEILPSVLNVGASSFPFAGGVIDLANLEARPGDGFAIDVVVDDAVVAPSDSEEPVLNVAAKVFGTYLRPERRFEFDEIALSTPVGALFGSLHIQRAATSPEISFAAKIDTMETRGVKQLWPFWMAKRPRQWVLNNLFGGTITDASVRVFVPAGRIAETGGELALGPDQLQIDFDYDRARLNVAGDIPPLRDAAGRLTLRGGRLDVSLGRGTAYFPTGRTVDVTEGRFSIPQARARPLMAELDIKVAGTADAVAELIAYRPINALKDVGFEPADFSGPMTSHVQATFGLISEQRPPPADWRVEAVLDGVDVGRTVEGRTFSALKGDLLVDPAKAVLDADAVVDGMAMHLALTEPLNDASAVSRRRVVKARLDAAARDMLAPGLNDILSGPVDVTLTLERDGRQAIEADLTDTRLVLPWIGWSKGPGVEAGASMRLVEAGGGAVAVENVVLDGDGFSARGRMNLDGTSLRSARFERMQLAPGDDAAVSIDRQGDGYRIEVTGSALDLRALMRRMRAGDDGKAQSGAAERIDVTASLETARGFNGEKLSAVRVRYAGFGSAVTALEIRAVTGSGQAVVADVSQAQDGRTLTISSGDAGALARFVDVYGKINGGLLNVRLRRSGEEPYLGFVDLRNFTVVGEQRLNSLLRTPAPNSNRSLNDAVRADIDLSVATFERAYARIATGGGTLQLFDGVLRGKEIGSTFQGLVNDGQGNMDMTGTFMPAYGLNRLFGAVPIVGAILGNGRDRGLIGITFRLSGPTDQPRLQVNPLSVIAPGVFRQIFEF